ncbi:MAG: type II toxin-antitoxin system RelE/ParE family toxin [Candidatus Binatales bacterium]
MEGQRISGAPGKCLVWLSTEIKTPPFSRDARVETGVLLRRLQQGESLSLPHSRPMPSIGIRCHELRIVDENNAWRIVYRIDSDAVVVVDAFGKKAQRTPFEVIERCKARLRRYDQLAR